jgi:hypothetical protein
MGTTVQIQHCHPNCKLSMDKNRHLPNFGPLAMNALLLRCDAIKRAPNAPGALQME